MHDTLEHLREGPFDKAFQSLLKALQHAHRLLLGFRGHDGIRPPLAHLLRKVDRHF
ncbi:hypothetical protein M1L60_44070 [Actinoplanes sp. TRM 88003]|uniref:Uncharacterized protein n=1 Tax=Paractinoplanes aksuensis TaxID=2939490 RepID=A0ABT1E363_9ACTN|nr:hypothetical protein [Actinoplanes aksuensis]MCO8277578.1 hypothetical protein [Actinoplanes aksuensis]